MKLAPKDYLAVLELLIIPPEEGIRIIDGSVLTGRHVLGHAPDEYALYCFSNTEIKQIDLINLIHRLYSPDYLLTLIHIGGSDPRYEEIRLDNFNPKEFASPKIFILFKPVIVNASLIAFRELIAHLRSAEGCPWDRKQTHQTLRTNLLEETYEVLDAIDGQNSEAVREELGDLLLQILLHAQIASENTQFNIFDVIAGIHQKITFRHPHVFADLNLASVDGVTRNWEILKSQERSKKGEPSSKSILASVPNELPALSKAQKFQERAARVGFDWPNIQPVFEKFEEELRELKDARDDQSREMELGDLLFALVNLIRWYGFDAESVLRQANTRFLKRFNYIEETVHVQGKRMTDLTLDEMDKIWEQAKQVEAESAQNGQ